MSWAQLLAIQEEAVEEVRAELASPPQACPNDGEPLIPTPDGVGVFCRFDGYQWPRDGR